MIKHFEDILKSELAKQLPGEEAHFMMMPIARNDNLIKPSGKISPLKSAVLILLYEDEYQHLRFPLIQRPTYNGAHSGQVSLPGGKAEKDDANIFHTALRETEEEIGIDASNIEVVGQLTDLFIWVSNFLVTPIVGITHKKPVFTKDDNEVETIIETDLYDIINPAKRKEDTIVVRDKFRIQTPYFEIDSRVVWGATAMILSEFSMVIGRSGFFNSRI